VHRFEAPLESEAGERATSIVVPLDVPAVFGRARAPVRGSINGFPFRSTIAKYGDRYYLPVNAALRDEAGVGAGETVEIEVERDDEPRVVEAPADLRAALDRDPEAARFFDGLSYTHRKEYVQWIDEARRSETRARRIEKTVAMLRGGRTQR
jgi:hypothetical protein